MLLNHDFLYTVLGINRGVGAVRKINYHQLVRVFHVGINLGFETDSGWFDSGKSIAKAKYEHVPANAVENVLSAIQAAYQRRIYEYGLTKNIKLVYLIYSLLQICWSSSRQPGGV